jgi:hypothetical protein
MPHKEIHFFDEHYDRGEQWYFDHFAMELDETVCGEYTPDYLAHPYAIDRLAKVSPTSKLIVSLRNPVERAYSAYKLLLAHGTYRDLSFKEAFSPESELAVGGLYGRHLQRLFNLFPRDQVKILFFDDILREPLEVIQDLYSWLSVDPLYCPAQVHNVYNVSGMPNVQRAFSLSKLQRFLYGSPLAQVVEAMKHSTLVASWRRRSITVTSQQSKDLTGVDEVQRFFEEDTELLSRVLGSPVPWAKSVLV